MSAPELELAATVTRGAVRCSAWLGVIGLMGFAWAVLEWKRKEVAALRVLLAVAGLGLIALGQRMRAVETRLETLESLANGQSQPKAHQEAK